MSFLGSMFSGDRGTGFQAEGAGIISPYGPQQANQTYEQVQQGLQQQQNFINALQGQGGIQNQSNVFNQQQALANQLQAQAQGQGPNPALAQLNQATSANIANQAALMAGQRGASANAGLLARQAAQQGGALQQQAVGQGAIMTAQQQLAAQQALANQQANMANLSTNQVGQLAGSIQGYNQAAQGAQANVLNSIAGVNNANVGMRSNMNSANAAIAGINAQGQHQMTQQMSTGILQSLMAHGGMVKHYADGGQVELKGPQSFVGQFMAPSVQVAAPEVSSTNIPTLQPGVKGGDGGGGGLLKLAMLKGGGNVPGHAEVKGDSYSNDTVPAMLSPGEIVIPRSISQSKDAGEKAKAFVEACLAKSGMRK